MSTISPPPEACELPVRKSLHPIHQSSLLLPPRTSSGSRLHYLPIALSLFFPITTALCYFIALGMGHINAFFAFISDAGTVPPEQNVFAQLMNMGAGLFAYFVYIRYVQVEQYMKRRYHRTTTISNVIALAFGFVSAIGISLVGNFPELVKKEVHVIGAFLAFVGISIYSIFQGYFTFKLLPHFQSKFIAYLRIFVGVLGLMLYFGSQSTIIVALQTAKNRAKIDGKPESLKWAKEERGYECRAASVIMEWLLLGIFDIFIITFAAEFKRFKVATPHVIFIMPIPEYVEITESLDQTETMEYRDDEFSEFTEMTGQTEGRSSKQQFEIELDDESFEVTPVTGGKKFTRKKRFEC